MIYWQCPKCKHRVKEEESICDKCKRKRDGREDTYNLTKKDERTLEELESIIRVAHAKAMSNSESVPPKNSIVINLPNEWKWWLLLLLAGINIVLIIVIVVLVKTR
jgi:hypothetical protein